MKYFKFLMLLAFSSVMFTMAKSQTNSSLSVTGGTVAQGGILNVLITVSNTGSNSILANKVRPKLSVTASIGLPVVNALQTGLPAGWIILANGTVPGVIEICNGTDVIPAGVTRSFSIKIQGNVIGTGSLNGSTSFGPGTGVCTGLGSLSGDDPIDNGSSSTFTVTTPPACALTATAAAGTIACNGGTTTLTATPAGSSNTLEYSITGGAPFQAANTFTVGAGTYTVTVREVATPTCTVNATAVVIGQPSAIVPNVINTPIGAVGSTNGTATAAPTGGTGAFTYAWAPGGQTTATATGLAAGTYTVTITDANLCSTSATTTIGVAACNLTASISSGTIACNGGTTTITAGSASAVGSVEYSLNGGAYQSSNLFTGVVAGSYTITAREVSNNLCTATSSSLSVSQPAALVGSAIATPILCNGGSSNVTVSAVGGTAPYTGTGVFARTAGAYSFTVTDANGCVSTVTGTVAEPAALVVNATFAPISVFGGTTIVNVAATGGTAPYTGTGAFTRADGTFSFGVTDANGCTTTSTITIAPFSTPVTADPALGQMTFVTMANASQSANTLLFTQDYKLRIPFFNLNQVDIIPNGTIKLTIDLGTRMQLAAGFNLAGAPLNNFFTWTSAVVAGKVIITGTQIADIPADYFSTLSFNVRGTLSCTSTATTTISVVNLAALLIDEDTNNNASLIQYTLPVTIASTQVNVTCNGANNGIINPIVSAGATVVIRNASNAVVSTTNLAPGVYTLTATATGDAPLSNTCTNVTNVTIVQPAVLAATLVSVVNNVCNSGSNGVVTASSTGGTAPYTYTIAGPSVNTSGLTSGIFTNLLAGSYTITSKDANNCTATVNATVTQPVGTAPNLALGSDFTDNLFSTSGVSQVIVYNVTEIAGNPAVGDTIRITNVPGFTISFNNAVFSTVVGPTTYTLDNSRWKIDNSNSAYVSIILTDPSNLTGPGTILCNQRVNVAVTLTRNTSDITTFTLSARLRRANGEVNLSNNLNSIVLTAE